MGKGDVKLLGTWPSPFVTRVKIALKLKSVDYEYQEENLGSKSELLIKSNPVYKKIPVLLHGGKPICESLIIVQYIDEAWTDIGSSILPCDPYDRAVARFWAAYVDDKIFPTIRGLGMAKGEEAKAAVVKELKDGLVLLEEAFLKSSGKVKPFFGGDEIGYLDIAFGSFLAWLKVTEKYFHIKLLEEATTPRLVSWADSFCKHPAVKDEMPNTHKLFEYAQNVVFPMIRAAAAAAK
ncbi:Glutathione S-transferase U17 [Dionaea muscipula]